MAGKYAVETVFSAIDKMTAPIKKIESVTKKFGVTSSSISTMLKNGYSNAEKSLAAAGEKARSLIPNLTAAGAAFAVDGVKSAMSFEQELRGCLVSF